MRTPTELEPRHLLAAYASGAFPMDDAWDADGPVEFYESDPRAILPLPVRVPRTVARELRRSPYELRFSTAFRDVIESCTRRGDADGVWLSARLVEALVRLHELGCAHSLEAWHGGRLVGGLYGVELGRAFFAESMFHVAPGAGSFAIVRGTEALAARGIELVDIQMPSAHLARFGAVTIPGREFRRRLAAALR